jgi:hypothetical protein
MQEGKEAWKTKEIRKKFMGPHRRKQSMSKNRRSEAQQPSLAWNKNIRVFFTLYKRGATEKKMKSRSREKNKERRRRIEGFCKGDLSLIFKFFLFHVFSFVLCYVF